MVAIGLAALAPAASAKQRPISGSLAKSGYVVAALAPNGRTTSARVAKGKFKVAAPAKVVTLQLRDAKGRYAGPVVVGQKGKNVILGVRAGASLGKIALKKGFGVAHPPKRSIVTSIAAARRGAGPVGAGKLGYVKRPSAGKLGPGLDADRDGIPDAMDIDDDGDLILDHVDSSGTKARAADIGLQASPSWLLNVGLETSFLAGDANAAGYALNWNARNAALPESSFSGYIDKALDLRGVIVFQDRDLGIECQAIWCTPFGKASDITGAKRFPADFPLTGASYPLAPSVESFNPDREAIIATFDNPLRVSAVRPHASAAEVSPQDVLLMHTPATFATAWMTQISYFFGTVPALSAWSDGGSTLTPVAYPVARNGPGSQSNPISVTPGADGHYRVRMSVWAPQAAIGGGAYQTLGHLQYGVDGRTNGPQKSTVNCSAAQDAFSDASPNVQLNPAATGFTDLGGDRPIAASDTMTFTVDQSRCLSASGLPGWAPGQPSVEVFVYARSATGDVAEGVGFAFKPADQQQGGGGGGGGPTSPASGTWSFSGGSPGADVGWTVHMNDAGITKLRIQFHEATPVVSHTDPAGWTCTTVTVSNPNDAVECTHPTGEAAGTDVSGAVTLSNAGTNGMPVTLTVTENGTATTSDMTQK